MLETDRLILRRPNIDDADIFFELENDPEVYRHLPPGRPFDRKTVVERLKKNIDDENSLRPFGTWVAESKTNNDFVAWALLMKVAPNDYRLGYVVRKKYWGRGYATEVAQAITNVGIKNGLKVIEAVTSLENTASSRVLEKVGFSFKEVIPGEKPDIKLNLYQLKKIKEP